MLSPSASSSAVTIPTPGKSILKRPPPPQQSFFAVALSKLRPTQQQQTNSTDNEATTLKRAHFILPEMTTVYPISAANPPSTPSLKEEKKSIEERELERRRRVVRGNATGADASVPEDWWSMDKVESFYRECCVGREETPDPGISTALKHSAGSSPRTVDLSGVQLALGSASVLSDVFTIEWGLRKLVFKECDLDEQILKPMLHALLIPDTLTFLSVASNRRLKAPAFRLIGAYIQKTKSLQFLDLSQNSLDKKSIEYIAAALPEAPRPGLVSLRLDDCSMKPAALDALANTVRKASLRNISLRHNRINATGAVALALMIKDYPDAVPLTNGTSSGLSSPTSGSPNFSVSSLPPASPPQPGNALPSLITSLPPPQRSGPLPPPPRHPQSGPQTTYTPYIPRSKRAAGAAAGSMSPISPTQPPVPVFTTSARGGVTARHPVQQANGHAPPHSGHGPSAALLEKVRALDNLPRLGALRTLDLKGNDIRTGITYIAQVLKRNRTLKVLNISENKLDVQGLITVADALKYNSSLETLDLSKNPCCGPALEGIQSLRTAFTLNGSLKRLFLSSTNMTSAGAIALAEFLPESTSLIHLDLTMNDLDLAGVMALSSGLKANHIMRCLDLNIPPSNEEMARMCRDILSSCVRNTEEAEKASQATSPEGTTASGRGQGKGVWGMLEESELAKIIRQDDKKKVKAQIEPSPVPTVAPTDLPSPPQSESDVVSRARSCKGEVEEGLKSAAPSEVVGLARRVEEMQALVVSAIEETTEPDRLEELLSLNDDLTSLMKRCKPTPPQLTLRGLGIHLNGDPVTGPVTEESECEAGKTDDEDDIPTTPRVDKGKGRAEPEPEEPEKVLTPIQNPPTFMIGEDEEDNEDHNVLGDDVDALSPTDRSRNWVAEEGEVFRKGTALLGPAEMEGDYDSEDLRRELLEAMVERPPPRPIVDDFGMEVSPDQGVKSPKSPEEEKKFDTKLPPRPYVRRTRSSSSTVGGEASPTAESPTSPVVTSPTATLKKAFNLGRTLSSGSKDSLQSQNSLQ